MDKVLSESVVISLPTDLENIIQVLTEFQRLAIHVEHLESRNKAPGGSSCQDNEKDYFIEFKSPSQEVTQTLLAGIGKLSSAVKFSSSVDNAPPSLSPWFPRHVSDLSRCCTALFKYGSELGSDHPGYGDTKYMQRRKQIADVAMGYKYGDKIPRIDFTELEIKTWGEVFQKQTQLYPTHACREYNTHFPRLFSACGYREDNIPQLEDVSQYLKAQTGWQLWPVIGWISARDFLNALAFRVFPTTQYIRHHSSPFYTPEPDICHELMGHAPLFCDPCFAQFSQDIGLASLGISDEWVEKLASLYWYTVEFGMVDEDGAPKAYGAGLLSGCQELKYCITDTPKRHDFDIEKAISTTYPETGLQPLYFVASNMKDMRRKLLEFTHTIPREFTLHYDPSTQCVKVLTGQEMKRLTKDMEQQMTLLI